MPLAQINALQALKRFSVSAGAPAWVTALLSVAAVAFSSQWGTVFVSAFSGQLALTLIKLFFFLALSLISLAHVLKPVGRLSSFLFWSGRSLAEVAFDSSAVAFGVFLGLMPALMYDMGFGKGAALSFHILLLFGSIAALVWVAAAAEQLLGPLPKLWQRLAIQAIALAMAANSLLALYCEPWKEVDGVKFEPNAAACACMKWPDYITLRANPALQGTPRDETAQRP